MFVSIIFPIFTALRLPQLEFFSPISQIFPELWLPQVAQVFAFFSELRQPQFAQNAS